ncbi:NAD(P)/FAD-dependent oxidoreductase [Bradyrhizobium viridifuturi]|jgi:cyclohexanone monooxygenase|uniref:flavin-containing monooxygenase n=5 Tax=Bacteria TaxID=2 RepID=UPI0003979573|nr:MULTISPECIES: NAD(P)/FAD-dependent oxidoreductase [unclassified Bradyrhizobium]ERF86563.1 MAG: chaperonin GroES [Bradyrhizobium sp. DFCI-1]MBR1037819.1 NAD(P)/FAD-dependent oxidoreductase [Bradyrhizobium viridifuturi]MBR2119689.1 NAD(P)/FAD-dependent oxidoreductase [Afipia sp.]MCA3796850.1 NAD(P)/FAD-dependent oxidoreductase [Burkholderia sp.]MBI5322191.1 NAD(P)/FAD-dependent oxidoreductase [Bradyrhizobium sp.]
MIADNTTRQERPGEMGAVFDAVIVGAGFAGMYMLHRLRGLSFSARVFEAGSGVGGTWYWNRYPGARCDVESMQYSFSFSEELDQEWNWSEKYAPQAEILSYANHVADRFDLRRDIVFDTRVTAATFDEDAGCWLIETNRGDRVLARFCIMAVGCLSAPNRPNFRGMKNFRGPIYHTGEWPHEGVDFTGLRVGVIGTGSSAIQSIPIIAQQAAHLTVFQRTATWSVPARNESLTSEYLQAAKADYPALRAKARGRPTGFYFPFNMKPALEAAPEERERQYEEAWTRGGLPFLGAFGDLLFEKAANDTIADFARRKIRGIVKDPATADLLCPDNVFGCKRLCVDTSYFETYNLEHVKLVDVSKTPIERFTPDGIEVDGVAYPLDTAVCATGFAAMTGSFDKIAITGRKGLTLAEKWRAGPRAYLGIASAGFPNLFTITGPGSPSVLASMIQAIEQHVDWLADCMAHMRDVGAATIEPKREDEDAWVEHVTDVSTVSLRSTCSSWYVGTNIPGRPRVFMPYIGGFPVYVQKCNEVMSAGFDGFVLEGAPASNAAPQVRYTERWRVPIDIDVISPAAVAAKRVPVV